MLENDFQQKLLREANHENKGLVDSWAAGDIGTRLYIGQKCPESNLLEFLPKKHSEKI